MEHIGAGLAALGVIGPGIGIGILTGLAAQAIGGDHHVDDGAAGGGHLAAILERQAGLGFHASPRKNYGRACQGSTTGTLRSLKCRRFRVASVARRASAMPAI